MIYDKTGIILKAIQKQYNIYREVILKQLLIFYFILNNKFRVNVQLLFFQIRVHQ
jgi:hypothetical protein